MKPRLTQLERRAHAACDTIRRYAQSNDPYHFAVLWKRSATWGLCPSIMYSGQKAAHASGCGYDKLSAVVAEFLSPLCPGVNLGGGAGIDHVIQTLGACGWELRHLYEGRTEDSFSIRPVKP